MVGPGPAALRHDVYAALSAITSSVLASTEPGSRPPSEWRPGEKQNAQRVDRALSIIGDALQRDRVDLVTLSVALRVMRSACGVRSLVSGQIAPAAAADSGLLGWSDTRAHVLTANSGTLAHTVTRSEPMSTPSSR